MTTKPKCKTQHKLTNAFGIHDGKMLCRGCREWVVPDGATKPKRKPKHRHRYTCRLCRLGTYGHAIHKPRCKCGKVRHDKEAV